MSAVLERTIAAARSPNADMAARAQTRVDNLIKPRGSLGSLEDFYVRLAAMQGTLKPSLPKKAVAVFCADHGIVAEGVATGDQSVTLAQARNMARGATGVCALAHAANAAVVPIDVGIAADYADPGIRRRRVRAGTANFSRGTAMSRAEAVACVEAGIAAADELFDEGCDILGTGEMGIGNTSPSAAMLAVFAGLPAAEVVGLGANLPPERLAHKAAAVQRGIDANRPDPADPLGVLAAVGGLEIGAMAGAMLAGAARGRPVVVDGFISTVSALLALRLQPLAGAWLFASHRSREQGAALASRLAGLEPGLDLGLRLGEGSGAALLFPVLDAACSMSARMLSFAETGIAPV